MSPNVWPGGELVHRDRNRAWLHDNKIVSACSYVCVCPTGAASEPGGDAGVGRPRLESAASLYVWPWCSQRDAQAAQNEKCPLEVELGVWEIKRWSRWGKGGPEVVRSSEQS